VEKIKAKFENKFILKDNINTLEGGIIQSLLFFLYTLSFDLKKIGIITPYLNQEIALKEKLERYKIKDNIITIDKSQGSEKDIIIFSFSKSDYEEAKILQSAERLNVAFTRAKKKLICIGDITYLKDINNLQNYLKLIIDRKHIFEHPLDFNFDIY